MSGDVTIGALKRLDTLMAGQDIDSVDINGGAIDGATIGAASPAAGTFTTLTSTTTAGVANRVPVALTATIALTAALNANRPNIVTGTATAAYTLPEATGTGNEYPIYIGQVNTNGLTFVTPDLVNSLMYGKANMLDVDSTAATAFFTVTAGDTNTVTFDGTTKGGQIGDTVIFTDLATDVFAVHVESRVPAGSNVASPFSAA